MQFQLAIKKVGDAFEGALIVDGRLQRASRVHSISALFDVFAAPLLAAERGDGDEVTITVNILTAAQIEAEKKSLAR